MAKVPTTRLGLNQTRATLRVARSGARLLRSKRAVLADEFFRLTREVLGGRTLLEEELREAQRALFIAEGLEGEAALESLALAAAREVPVELADRRVWGVAVPSIQAPRLVRSADARGASLVSWGLSSTETARRHERAVELLIDVGSKEAYLRRLADEIRETSRRINSLEQLVIPRLAREAARIELALDESAREDLVRSSRAFHSPEPAPAQSVRPRPSDRRR
jgi:V/A-type H+-transporting ATPase subunit D